MCISRDFANTSLLFAQIVMYSVFSVLFFLYSFLFFPFLISERINLFLGIDPLSKHFWPFPLNFARSVFEIRYKTHYSVFIFGLRIVLHWKRNFSTSLIDSEQMLKINELLMRHYVFRCWLLSLFCRGGDIKRMEKASSIIVQNVIRCLYENDVPSVRWSRVKSVFLPRCWWWKKLLPKLFKIEIFLFYSINGCKYVLTITLIVSYMLISLA